MEKARIARAVAEIRYFEKEIKAYYIEHERYPNSLLELGRSFNNLLDPWGNQYQYLLIAGAGFVDSGGSADTYYARGSWTSGIVTVAAGGKAGLWSGSWFVSEAWAAPDGGAAPRKDRFLVPINSDYDLYSMGPDGQSSQPLTVPVSMDDIIHASDGAYVGLAENF
ncbi:MAG: hypothetical protein EXR96_05970 [Nitrospiraceae bacterium]|nr:hypothetical protein [Nitrospiraceae bacterium]